MDIPAAAILPSELSDSKDALKQILQSEPRDAHVLRTEFETCLQGFAIVNLEIGLTFASTAKTDPENIDRIKRNGKVHGDLLTDRSFLHNWSKAKTSAQNARD